MKTSKTMFIIKTISPYCRPKSSDMIENISPELASSTLVALSDNMAPIDLYMDQFSKYIDESNTIIESIDIPIHHLSLFQPFMLINFNKSIVLREFECEFYVNQLQSLYQDIQTTSAILYMSNNIFNFNLKQLDPLSHAFHVLYSECTTWDGFIDSLSDKYLIDSIFIDPLIIERLIVEDNIMKNRYRLFTDKVESDFGGDNNGW